MELTYTERRTGFDKGRRYANPLYFSQARSWATRVTVEGSYPNIVAAYEERGVPVQVVDKHGSYEPAPVSALPVSAAGVDIPSDWRDLPWSRPKETGGLTLRGLVKSLGGTAVNGTEARRIIAEAINAQPES